MLVFSVSVGDPKNGPHKDADLTITIDRADFEATMMGKKTLMAQIDDGTAKIDGDRAVLEQLASTLLHFEMGFEILPGTKSQPPEDDLDAYEVGPVDLHGE